MASNMKENYVLPYNLAKISADVIENVYNLVMPEDEIGYIAIHFGSYLEKNIIYTGCCITLYTHTTTNYCK